MKPITVSITTLGKSAQVKRLLESISSHKNIETILIVNTSPVDSLTIEDIDESNSDMASSISIHNLPGGSLPQARRFAANRALTKYIAFFDDDIILPRSYLENAIIFLDHNNQYIGVGGGYEECVPASPSMFARIGGRLFDIRRNLDINIIKSNSWTESVNFPSMARDCDAQWLQGCNSVLRVDPIVISSIESRLKKWAYLEDVFLGYRLTYIHGKKLMLLKNLLVLHHPLAPSSGKMSQETVKMRAVNRVALWKEMRANGHSSSLLTFIWSLIGNLLLIQKEIRSTSPNGICVLLRLLPALESTQDLA